MEPDNTTSEQTVQEVFAEAKTLAQNGQIAKALPLFKQIVDAAPETPRAHYCLALAYRDTGQFDNAIEVAQQGIDTQDDIFDLLILLAACLREIKKADEAIATLEKAEAIHPQHPTVLLNLTIMHFDKGHKDKVRNYAERTLEIAPMAAQAHYFLAKTNKYSSVSNEHIAMMQSVSEHADKMSPHDIAYIHFALAKAYEDLKNYDTAFEHYTKANKVIRDTYNFSISNLTDNITALRDTLNAEAIDAFAHHGVKDKTPIFIVGMPRSGTSLVEQILASHKDVYGAGEKKEIEEIKRHIFGDTPADYRHNLTKCTPERITSAANYYLSSIEKYSQDHQLVVDKMPMNFCYIGLIKTLFPEAKIIHCARNAQDTCLSIFRSFFGDNLPYAYDLDEIAAFYNLYREQIRYWQMHFPGDIYDIFYEDLVTHQKQETQKLLTFCALDWDDTCLAFYNTDRTINTASSLQVTQPVYNSSVHYWTHYEDLLPENLLKLQSYN